MGSTSARIEGAPRRAARAGTGLFGLVILLAACGGSTETLGEISVATLEPIRGDGARMRVAAGESVESGSLARLRLDAGPWLLLGDAALTIGEEGEVQLASGRAFVHVPADGALVLRVGEAQLTARDAAFSIEDGALYVVDGEVSHRQGEQLRRVRAGERLAGGAVEAAALWEDWTGGLARPGPGLAGDVAIGALEGRVPDEIGQARWPLVIRRLDVKVRVVEDLAITEVEQVFFNPASETVEGLYRIRVPRGAVLQRFAVDRDGRLVDGYVREKAQARQAYEAQVYRGSTLDPALLEWVAPGAYQARIYPIAPGETRRIAVRYAEWLERPGAPSEEGELAPRVYRFPMAPGGATPPHVQELAFEADLSEAGAGRVRAGFGAEVDGDVVRLRKSDLRPRADLVLELWDGEERAEGLRAWRAEHDPPPRDPRAGAMPDEQELDYVYVPVVLPERLFAEAGGAQGMDLVVVADVSAGTDRSHLELGRSVIEALAAHLEQGDRVAILAGDVSLRPLAGDGALGPAEPARVERLLDALAREPAGGASDLGGALAEAAALLDPERHGVVVYVGDGAPTVGELGAEALLERVQRLPHPLRAYGVGVGGDANLDLLDAVTRGGGLALRVETRAAAAEAALELLAHARRPAAQRVSVELAGAEQVFPRAATDVVRGAVLPVVGRVEESLPSEIVVRGLVAGSEFEERLAIREVRVEDEGDLRLRWAGERLRQLLLGGGQREEIADLGVRYGLITPFTSFYVPSAAELASLGPAARELYRDLRHLRARPSSVPALLPTTALFALPGCTLSDAEPPASEAASSAAPEPEEVEEEAWADQEGQMGANQDRGEATANRYAIQGPSDDMDPQMAREQARPTTAARRPAPPPAASAEAEPAPEVATAAVDEVPNEPAPGGLDGLADGSGSSAGFGGLGLRGSGSGGGGASAMGSRTSSTRGPRRSRRRARPRGAEERERSEADEAQARIVGALGALSGEEGGSVLEDILGGDARDLDVPNGWTGRADLTVSPNAARIVVELQQHHDASAHRTRRCSDAADLLLDDRVALWRERLGRASGVSGLLEVYREARRDCELPRWRDRRALLNLMLRHAGNIRRMVQLYRFLDDGSARSYLRGAILRRVRSPADLRVAREAFGAVANDPELVAQVLERAGEGPGRIRALRRLTEQFPGNVDLKLQLLEELERQGRVAEARRLAAELRADPLTDAGVRTAIGEMFLRFEDEPEARRVFSEIVEFAPEDALARRRLGDLYRAHGWFEDAYRQYQTLAAITPDDPSVALLLAQAAAGAGRVDEALRLEQGLAATSDPGAVGGLGRVALLWSSVRFAELRKEARAEGDAERLEALEARMRRSGVLRQASGLRATLTWSHPDAGLSLWAAHPRLGLTRPTDLAPEYGLEAFDVEEQEDGRYELEVRRAEPARQRHRTDVVAKLVVVWNEGQEDEKVEVRELRFDGERERLAFHLEGRELEEVSR